MTVEFAPDTHTYWVDGKVVPSVTELCRPFGPDYEEPDELVERALDAAADRGVTMHGYLEHRLSGGFREDFELPDEYTGYAASAELFLEEHRITPLLIETPIGCDQFAGTPDLVCELDGAVAIVDYKFVSVLAKTKVAAQLAGYDALCQMAGVFPEKLIAVQFLPDGTYRFYPVDRTAAENYFRMCRNIYEAKNKKHPRGRIE